MQKENKILIGMLLLSVLILTVLVLVIMDSMVASYKSRVLSEYKTEVNSSLSDWEFIEEIINMNIIQKQRINFLEDELAEKNILIESVLKRFNTSLNLSLSPFNRIREEDISIYNDRIIIYVDKAFGVTITPSKSMYPYVREGVFALETKPGSPKEIRSGDIIGFESEAFNTTIIHRIIDIGEDEKGWYAITKGDNNPVPDPGRVRFEDIHGVLIGLIY